MALLASESSNMVVGSADVLDQQSLSLAMSGSAGIDLSGFVFDDLHGNRPTFFESQTFSQDGYKFAATLPSASSSFTTLVEPDLDSALAGGCISGFDQLQSSASASCVPAQGTQAWTSGDVSWASGGPEQAASRGEAAQPAPYMNGHVEYDQWSMVQPTHEASASSSQRHPWDFQQSVEQYSYANDLPAYSYDDQVVGSDLFVDLDGQFVTISSNPPEYQENHDTQVRAIDAPVPPYVSLRLDAPQPAPAYSARPVYKPSLSNQMTFDQSSISTSTSFTSSLADAMKMPIMDFPSSSSINSKRRKSSHHHISHSLSNTPIQATW